MGRKQKKQYGMTKKAFSCLLAISLLAIPFFSHLPMAAAAEKEEAVLTSSEMEVTIDRTFPRVKAGLAFTLPARKRIPRVQKNPRQPWLP